MNHTHFKLTTHELGLYYNSALYLPRVLEQVSRKSPVLVTLTSHSDSDFKHQPQRK